MIAKKVKITSVTPEDKFNVVGKQGDLELDSLAIHKRLIITNIEGGFLNTSPIQKIEELKTGVLVTTRNSVYELTYL